MRMFQDTDRVTNGLKEAITLLCKTGLNFQSELSIDGLLGITLDNNEVFLVSIKEIIKNPRDFQVTSSGGSTPDGRSWDVSQADGRKRKIETKWSSGGDMSGQKNAEKQKKSRFSRTFKSPCVDSDADQPLSLVSRSRDENQSLDSLRGNTSSSYIQAEQEEPLSLIKVGSPKHNVSADSEMESTVYHAESEKCYDAEAVHTVARDEAGDRTESALSEIAKTEHAEDIACSENGQRDIYLAAGALSSAVEGSESKETDTTAKRKAPATSHVAVENICGPIGREPDEESVRPSSKASMASQDSTNNSLSSTARHNLNNESPHPLSFSSESQAGSEHPPEPKVKQEPQEWNSSPGPEPVQSRPPPSSSRRRKNKDAKRYSNTTNFYNVYESGTSSAGGGSPPASTQVTSAATPLKEEQTPGTPPLWASQPPPGFIDPDSHTKWLQSIAAYVHGVEGSPSPAALLAKAANPVMPVLKVPGPIPAHLHAPAANFSPQVNVCEVKSLCAVST